MISLRIRCDGGSSIGMGHVMRCLALADACRKLGGFAIRFYSRALDGAAARIIQEQGFDLRLLPDSLTPEQEIEILGEGVPTKEVLTTVLIDSYEIGEKVHQKLRRSGLKVAAIDDVGERSFFVDLLINQNVGSESLRYETDPATIRLLGVSHVLLRPSFFQNSNFSRQYPPVAKSLLVSLGGSDPEDWTSLVLRGIRRIQDTRLRDLDVKVVLGPSYAGKAEVEISRWPANQKIPKLLRSVPEMTTPMQEADFALTAAGSTCYECAFLGLPSILMLVADNQKSIEKGLRESGIAISLGDAKRVSEEAICKAITSLALDATARKRMGEKGKSLVDGQGARRVAEALTQLSH